jgi:hypothetical protein
LGRLTIIKIALVDGDFVGGVIVFLAAEGFCGVALQEGVTGSGALRHAEAFRLNLPIITVSVGEVK